MRPYASGAAAASQRDRRSPAGTGLSRILLRLVLCGHKTNTVCEVGKTARLVRERFASRAFQGKPRSSGLIPARRTEKPGVLEFSKSGRSRSDSNPNWSKNFSVVT